MMKYLLFPQVAVMYYQTISLKERLTQKNTANFSYSKIWGHSSLNIGYNAEENLVLTQPTASENINKYKFYSGPDFSYNNSKSIMDLNDKWYSKIRYTYSLNYKDGYKNYQKEACIDKNHDGVCGVIVSPGPYSVDGLRITSFFSFPSYAICRSFSVTYFDKL